MADNPETKLWNVIDWLRILATILFTILLGIVYFWIAQIPNIDDVWRVFLLSIISNLIPTFILFVGAYFFFRHIERLRSERDADELASKVAFKLFQMFSEAQASTSLAEDKSMTYYGKSSDFEMKVHRELDVTRKLFDGKSNPQKLIIKFTNRGNNLIVIKKITYSDTGLGLPKTALLTTYRLDNNGHDILLPIRQENEIPPDGEYIVEICLAQKWDADTIDSLKGKWGYLHLDLVCSDQTINLQYAI